MMPLTFETQPFVLLDDARAQGAADARLFRNAQQIICADQIPDVAAALDALDHALADGAYVAGYMAYETGHAFEASLRLPRQTDHPLLWFGIFDAMERVPADQVAALLPDPRGAWLGAPQPDISFTNYAAVLDRIIHYIRAGDIYQANLTFPAHVDILGHPLAAYARLRQSAQAGYGGVVYTGDHWHVSASPELFFSLKSGQLTTKPMKGTARRGATPELDAAAATALAQDPKQRAENLMIVDLLRNDLSRISVPGSVAVPDLFRVETYPTIHQMISVITAQCAADMTLGNMVRHIFPCGSITGAPKIRAMDIIADAEQAPRGIYTGAIGYACGQHGEAQEAAFNVAIRTLSMAAGTDLAGPHRAVLGLGSGIVADSVAESEWDECMAKGEFVAQSGAVSGVENRPASRFDLIETMLFDPQLGIMRLDLHLARLAASAAAFGFPFDRHRIRNELQAASFRRQQAGKIRLLLSPAGTVSIQIDAKPAAPGAMPVPVAVVPLPVHPSDIRLRHKTTDRAFYDDARRAAGTWDVLFQLPDGQITEGSFTCLFVERDGMLLTPPLSAGLLPGVLRSDFLESGQAVEAPIYAHDLADGFWLGNSVRGLVPAVLKTT